MSDNENDKLLGSTSLTRTDAGSAAGLASELLSGIVTDIAALKEFMIGQAAFNQTLSEFVQGQLTKNEQVTDGLRLQSEGFAASAAVQNDLNAEAARLFGGLSEMKDKFNLMVDVLSDLDDRLQALDGKRSVVADAEQQPEKGEA